MQRILLLFAVLFFQMAPAQQPVFVKKWDKRFGGFHDDSFFTMEQTRDNGFILGGFSRSGIGGDKSEPIWGPNVYWILRVDIWMVKIDSLGNKEFDKGFGTDEYDNLHALHQTSDAGYIIGGYTASGISGDKTEPARGGGDFWIIKTDLSGNKEWDKTFGGTSGENLWALQPTKDGGYIFGGNSNSGIGGDKTQENWDSTYFHDDGWVVKVDSLGNKQWDKRFGGIGQDQMGTLLQTADGGYILGLYSASGMTGDKTQPAWGGGDFWIVRIDSIGNKIWDKRFGGTDWEFLQIIIETHDGNYLIAGDSRSAISGDVTSPGYQWMVKIDNNGNKIWDKGYNGGIGVFNSLSQTMDGGFLFANEIQGINGPDKSEPNLGTSQTWVVKTDSLGNKEWDKTIFTPNGQNFGRTIQTSDSCYVIATSAIEAGGYVSEPNRGSNDTTGDFWIMKFCWEIPDNAPLLDSESGVSVYPNPFTSDLSIFLQKANLKDATFTITNIMGQVVFHKEENNLAPSYTKMLDLSYLPDGVYLVEVVIDGERMVKKVVKE